MKSTFSKISKSMFTTQMERKLLNNGRKNWNPVEGTKDVFSDKKIDCSNFDKNKSIIKTKVNSLLDTVGVCILTNTGIEDPNSLSKYFSLAASETFSYEGGSFSRKKLAENVYDTGCPNYCNLYPHIEMSYQVVLPKYLSLTMLECPGNGQGPTMIVDNVSVTKKLLNTSLGEKLRKKRNQALQKTPQR